MSERDLDAEFERIIAGWDDEAPDPQLNPAAGALEASPDLTAETGEVGSSEPGGQGTAGASADQGVVDAGGTPADTGPSGTAGMPPGQSGGVLDLPIASTTSHAWRGSGPQSDDVDGLLDAVDPDDDHFVPPSEIDLPSAEADPMYWAIVVGLAGGPLLLLYVLLFDRDGSGWWIVTGLTMTVVGFILLVLRGGTERDPFDDGTRI
ncbi:hypothetical protein GCM10027053_04530 [Intrasporangium mesophilum]